MTEDCHWRTVTFWYVDCIDWHTKVLIDDEVYDDIITGTTCGEPYPEEQYIWECTYTYDDCDETDPDSECYDPSLDDGVDGGGGYDDNPPPPPPQDNPTPNADLLYNPNSTLYTSQKLKLETAIIAFKEKYPVYELLYDKLVELKVILTFKIDSSISTHAQFKLNGYLKFKNEDDIKVDFLTEELIHAVQYYGFYGDDMTPTVKNYEFEAKVFQDYACRVDDPFTGCGYIATINMSEDFYVPYRDWLFDVRDNEGFTFEDSAIFNDFCDEWNGYPGTSDPSFTPKLLNEYFEGIP